MVNLRLSMCHDTNDHKKMKLNYQLICHERQTPLPSIDDTGDIFAAYENRVRQLHNHKYMYHICWPLKIATLCKVLPTKLI